MFQTIKQFKLIEPNDKILLGVSGGPDSMAMLTIIQEFQRKLEQELPFTFAVVHVNHGIREEASQDEEFVRDFCQKNQIDFYSIRIDVEKIAHTRKIGIEEAGRKERYQFFDQIAQKIGANKIATAHNQNDKVETMIMNVLRGSGISGLKGIEPMRDNKYIRPLIECNRTEIEEFCQEKNLCPRIDQTNFDNTYTRNKIRNVVIPYLQQEFNPNILTTMDRLAQIVTEEEQYMDSQVQKIYTEIKETEDNHTIILSLSKFNCQEKVIKARIILYTITRLLGTAQGIEKIHIEDIIKLAQNKVGNKWLMPNKKIKVFVKKGQISFGVQEQGSVKA